jgi:hypothetical protein
MKIDLNAIKAQHLKRLEIDRQAAAKRIGFLTQAREDEIRKATALKFTYQQAMKRLLK